MSENMLFEVVVKSGREGVCCRRSQCSIGKSEMLHWRKTRLNGMLEKMSEGAVRTRLL